MRRGDVASAWAGIRPLVRDPNNPSDTQNLVRNHVIHTSPSNLVTIAGGKWTTYRSMAKETIDAAVKASVAALRNLTLPAVVVESDEDNAVAEDVIKVDASDRSPLRLGGQVSQACVQVWQDGVFAIGYNFPSGEMVQ